MTRRGRIRMISAARWPSAEAGPVTASAVPRISRKCAPSMLASVTSSTTRATRGLARMLRYLALPAMLKPAMSIVPRAAF